MVGPVCKVVHLVRVGIKIEQQVGVKRAEDQLPAALAQAHHRGFAGLGRIFHRHRAAPPLPSGQRQQRRTIGPGADVVQRDPGQVAERGRDIQCRNRLADQAGGKAGGADHQRNAGGAFEEVHLEPQPALAQHVAVVRDKDDHRLLPCRLQRRHNLADLVIDIRDIGEIGAARPGDHVIGQGVAVPVAGIQDAARMGVLIVEGNGRDLRHQMRAVFVEVPVFPPRDVRIMRMGEADSHHPGAGISRAGKVIDLLRGVKGHLVVIFQLVGDLGHSGAGDRAHVVIPPVDPLTWAAVIGRPAEIGGIDIGGQPLFKAVHLVGADEMHLA